MAEQQTRVLAALRQMIVGGALTPGERLVEQSLAQRLQVSRTPIRFALGILEREGLLGRSPSGGYLVRAFSPKQLDDAIVVRGVLEGLAARLVAEHGPSRGLIRELRRCLEISAEITSRAELGPAELADYSEMNVNFHRLIVEAAGNEALTRLLLVNSNTGFGAPDAIFFDEPPAPNRPRRLVYAHCQHEGIVEALEAGEGARAEALMREHALVGAIGPRLPASGLLRRAAAAEPGGLPSAVPLIAE